MSLNNARIVISCIISFKAVFSSARIHEISLQLLNGWTDLAEIFRTCPNFFQVIFWQGSEISQPPGPTRNGSFLQNDPLLSFVLEGNLRTGTEKYGAEYWFLGSECVMLTYFSTFLPKSDTLKSKSRNILLYILICTHWEPQGTTKCGAIWIFGFGHKIDPP